MAVNFEKLEKEVRHLTSRQKASLAKTLIEDLDSAVDEDVEKLWLEESKRRLEAYRQNEIQADDGEEVMGRLRQRLK